MFPYATHKKMASRNQGEPASSPSPSTHANLQQQEVGRRVRHCCLDGFHVAAMYAKRQELAAEGRRGSGLSSARHYRISTIWFRVRPHKRTGGG